MSDDENKVPESDPWANLESAAGEGEDGFAFAFDELGDEPAGEPANDPSPAEAEAADIPLSVFPRPESEPEFEDAINAGQDPFEAALAADGLGTEAEPDAEPGTGRSGIIALSEMAESIATDGGDEPGLFAADADADAEAAAETGGLSGVLSRELAGDDMFDEQQLARELAAEGSESPDFGDQPSESTSDDVSFHAGAAAPATDADDAFAGLGDAVAEEAITLPMAAGMVAGAAAAAGTPAKVAAATKPVAKAKSSGIGQLIGIVLGGLLAFPIAFGILIWGFQKDPFKFARQAPPQLAFLFPEKLRAAPERAAGKPNGKPTGKPRAAAGPDLSKARGLDDIPGLEVAGDSPAAKPERGAAATNAADATDEAAAPAATEPEGDAVAAAPKPEMKPDDESPAIPVPDPLAALDTAEPAPAAAPEPPPLDLTGVETAAAGAGEALDSLAAIDPAEPSRRKLLVGWYRQLARLGAEMALLEHVAAASGRPLEALPEAAGGVLDRVCGDSAAVAELDRLGTMWITSQKRQSDGVALVATVDTVRQVGPYWSTRLSIVGAGADGADRSVTAISRVQPAADAGDRVVVVGVLFDGDAVWAVDVRPVGAPPAVDLGE